MLTIFCTPKTFQGHFGVIQRNALASWRALGANCETLVFGDEEGASAAAEAAGARHFPVIERNEFGTPLLDDVFRQAHSVAHNDILCYVNSDIIFLADLLAAVGVVSAQYKRYLIVGRRWNIDLKEPIVFEDSETLEAFLSGVHRRAGVPLRRLQPGLLHFSETALRGDSILCGRPPAVGQLDSLRGEAAANTRHRCDGCHRAVHQNHDYSHTSEGRAGGKAAVWRGVEANEIANSPEAITSASTMRRI